MKRCAFLSTDNLEDFFVYDMMVAPHLESLGWEVEEVSWHDTKLNYDEFEIVVVRSTWDYQAHEKAFVECLKKIDRSSAVLENSLKTMQWNISKTYLRELNAKGIPIIPTIWCDQLSASDLDDPFSLLSCDEVVIKPYVSANSDFTYRLTPSELNAQILKITSEYSKKSAMIQPFINSIIEDGEYSLFYFNGEFSHAISKHPKQGDFRVQEEHGGELKVIKPSHAQFELAKSTLAALPDIPLYARIDIVDLGQHLAIIEVELIEPSLYFNMDSDAALRFAQALNNKYA